MFVRRRLRADYFYEQMFQMLAILDVEYGVSGVRASAKCLGVWGNLHIVQIALCVVSAGSG